MKDKYTTEELKGIIPQPEDSCPYFNNAILKIQKMINDSDSSLEDSILEDIEKGLNVIERIEIWTNEWMPNFDIIDEDEELSQAYILAAEDSLNKATQIDIKKTHENFKEVFSNDFVGQIEDLSFVALPEDNIELSEDDLKIAPIFVNIKKDELNDLIEELRSYASLKRAFTNHMKTAYKNHSIMNDLNDIIQPVELIEEQLSKNKKTYNLGVLGSEQSLNKLLNSNIITNIDLFLINKMPDEKKSEIIFDNLRTEGFEKVSFYKSLDNFKEGKGYKTQKLNIKNKLKNKI